MRSPAALALVCALLLAPLCLAGELEQQVTRVLELEDARAQDPEAWRPLLLGSEQAEVRRRAALGIGRGRAAALAPLLREAFAREQEPAVRGALALALGLCPDPASVEPLLVAALPPRSGGEVDPAARAAALLALGRQGASVPLPALFPALQDEDPGVRGAALLALGRLRGRRVTPKLALDPRVARALLERLTECLGEADPQVRWKAAYACFELEGLDVAAGWRESLLVHALDAPDPVVRLFAVRALGGAPEPDEGRVDRLLRALGDTDPHVAAAAASALARAAASVPAGRSRTVAALGEALGHVKGPADHHARRATAAALPDLLRPKGAPIAEGGRDDAAAALARLLACADQDPSGSVRGEALVAAARLVAEPSPLEAAGVIERVTAAAASESALARMAAARAARHLAGQRALLETLRGDPEPRVACEALGALGELAGADGAAPEVKAAARRAARQAARHGDLAIKTTGVSLLGEQGELEDVAAIAAVASASPGPANAEVRGECVNAWKALAGREDPPLKAAALQALRAALPDEASAVRIAATKALVELTGEKLDPPPPDPSRSTVALVAGEDLLSTAPNPRAVLHTSKGDVTLELLREEAPRHVKSFLTLARRGFYDGLRFHRIVSGFVAQGLDPRGDGWGSGDVLLKDEINPVPFLAGAVGMPNSGPDTGGCQVFLMHVPAPHLDGGYTVFARVVGGLEVVQALDLDDTCRVELLPP